MECHFVFSISLCGFSLSTASKLFKLNSINISQCYMLYWELTKSNSFPDILKKNTHIRLSERACLLTNTVPPLLNDTVMKDIHYSFLLYSRTIYPARIVPGIPWSVVTIPIRYFQIYSYLFINTCASKANNFTKVREKQPGQYFVKHFKRANLLAAVSSLYLRNTNCYMAQANNNNGCLKLPETATGMKVLVKKLV